MKNEQEMLDLFKVEELEKRYEMGWIKGASFSTGTSTDLQTGGTKFNTTFKLELDIGKE